VEITVSDVNDNTPQFDKCKTFIIIVLAHLNKAHLIF
jgi:hypothetical protein